MSKLALTLIPPFLRRHKLLELLIKFKIIDPIQSIRFNDNARAFVNLTDPEPRNVFIKNEFEPDFFSVASAFIKPKSTIFDIGANVGFCSSGLASL